MLGYFGNWLRLFRNWHVEPPFMHRQETSHYRFRSNFIGTQEREKADPAFSSPPQLIRLTCPRCHQVFLATLITVIPEACSRTYISSSSPVRRHHVLV